MVSAFRHQNFFILTLLTIITIFWSAKNWTYQVGKWKCCNHFIWFTDCQIPYVVQHEISSLQSKFFFCFFYSDHFTIEGFFEKLNLEPCMDALNQTSIKVIDSTVHHNTENIWKVHLCLTLVNVFVNTYSQVTFT